MKRFWHTNKEYCQLIYEHTGIWADRAAYTEDNSEYYLYYGQDKGQQIKQAIPKIKKVVAGLEGAQVIWLDSKECLMLRFTE